MTEQQAYMYLYSFTNRLKEQSLWLLFCNCKSVSVCGFVWVRECMICLLMTLDTAVICSCLCSNLSIQLSVLLFLSPCDYLLQLSQLAQSPVRCVLRHAGARIPLGSL